MIPIKQTTFGVPGGNCMSACIASLLEIPIGEVPYYQSDDTESQIEKFGQWLRPRGFYPMLLSRDAKVLGYHILCGQSPRGVGTHAVVAVGDTVVHDPHPSNRGILHVAKKVVLVPFDPVR